METNIVREFDKKISDETIINIPRKKTYDEIIDELEEENENLASNMPWNETEQATEIDITDAAKYSKNKLELFGNTEQTQYTGKNCFNKTDYTTIATGNNGNATNVKTENKITIITGDNSTSSGIYITKGNLISYITNYDSSNTYYVSLDIKANRNIEIKMGCDTRPNFDITTSNQRISVTTLINSNGLVIYSSENNAGDTIEITNIMISTASDTIYEPFVGNQPSPSPDFPQPIHVVTGNNSVEVQGKNLANLSILDNVPSINNGNLVYYKGGACTDYIEINNAKDYYFSYELIRPTTKYIVFYDENKTFIGYNTIDNFYNLNNFYNYSKTKYVRVRVDVLSYIKYVQLEQGSTATDYVPYYHADYPINLGSIELCKIGDYQDYLYKENGNWYKYGAINKIILDGTTETWGDVSTSGNFKRIDLRNTGALNAGSSRKTYALCTISRASTVEDYNINFNYQSNIFFYLPQGITTREEWWALLSQKTPELYYILEVATITQITDETLISQLDAIYEHLQLVKGTNIATITASDLAPNMELTYMQDLPAKLDKLEAMVIENS